MREYKFKAWLSGIGKMTYSHTLEELMNWDTKKEDNGTAIWLQWTGLVDRNKKEIYESDILEIFGGTNNGRKCHVVWEQEKACFRGSGNFLFQYLDSFNFVEFEVIGNIYENPDLLSNPSTD